jgi:hypothetical protein
LILCVVFVAVYPPWLGLGGRFPPSSPKQITDFLPLECLSDELVSGSVCGRLFWPPVQRGVHRFWFGGCPENAYHGVV